MTLDYDHLDSMISSGTNAPEPVFGVAPRCVKCGYELTGLTSLRCPECGAVTSRKTLKQQAADAKMKLRELPDINDWVTWGMYIGITGIGIRALGLLLDAPWKGGAVGAAGWAGRILALPCGLAALFMGLNIVRFLRLPKWMQDLSDVTPKTWAAFSAIIIGVILVITSLLNPF